MKLVYIYIYIYIHGGLFYVTHVQSLSSSDVLVNDNNTENDNGWPLVHDNDNENDYNLPNEN